MTCKFSITVCDISLFTCRTWLAAGSSSHRTIPSFCSFVIQVVRLWVINNKLIGRPFLLKDYVHFSQLVYQLIDRLIQDGKWLIAYNFYGVTAQNVYIYIVTILPDIMRVIKRRRRKGRSI